MVPARPWFGESKQFARYFNGVMIVSFIQMTIINNLCVLLSWISDFKYPRDYWVFLVLLTGLLLFNTYWIILSGTGERFIKEFEILDGRLKKVLFILSISLTIFGLGGIWVIRP